MVEVDSTLEVIGPHGPVTLLDVFEGRRQLIAYYFMWFAGQPAAEQCEGCTTHVSELAYLHSRDVAYATLCQGPYEEIRYRDFMGWEMPWYSAQDSAKALLSGRQVGKMHLVCYLRQGDRVFETYWTTGRGVEVMMAPTYPVGQDDLRPPGGVGGLARRLAAEVGDQRRTPLPRKRTPDCTVVPAAGRTFR
jgi:predicted dithiol-disulfide oxidoreductase (DUF899 family)